MDGLVGNGLNFKHLDKELSKPTDKRIFAVAKAIQKGYSIDKIHDLTKIDRWFLYKIRNIVETDKKLQKYKLNNLPSSLLKKAKEDGFSDIHDGLRCMAPFARCCWRTY